MADLIEIPISQLLEINRGASISPSEIKERTVSENTGIQYLRIANIENNYINNEMDFLKNIEDREYKYLLKENDIVLTKMGEPKFALAKNLEDKKIIVSQNFYILRCKENISPLYIRAFLESQLGFERLDNAYIKNTIPTLPVKNLERITVPFTDEVQKCQEKFVKEYEEEDRKRIELLTKYMLQNRNRKMLFDKMISK
ncbi:hypothetical protein [Treponema sp. C6A8]|uniref:hypothetical protein n=1 Tax=Treponema sp. C6A8 TaxID=1410609 RepID=UPI0004873843|nr:hypothetical protein [Treponema sp. C6A8]